MTLGEPVAPCSVDLVTHQWLRADLDGDGVDDVVAWAALSAEQRDPFETKGHLLSVCTASGSVSSVAAGSPNKPLKVLSIDPDATGRSELLVGGSSGVGPFHGGSFRLIDDELVPIGGLYSVVLPHYAAGGPGRSFGCVDVDGEGGNSTILVNIEYEFVGGDTLDEATSMDWRIIPWWDIEVDPERMVGSFELPAQREAARVTMSGTCRDQVLVPMW